MHVTFIDILRKRKRNVMPEEEQGFCFRRISLKCYPFGLVDSILWLYLAINLFHLVS